MLVTIIITLYNRKDLVVRTIESIRNIAYSDDVEVIIVDDGSTDNPFENISTYIDNINIFYHYKTNGGAADAKNFGALLANGKYIIFLDSDDYLINTTELLSYVRGASKHEYTFFYSTSMIVKIGDSEVEEFISDEILIQKDIYKYVLAYPMNYAGKPTYVIQREAFINSGGFTKDFKWGDAMLFWRRFLSQANCCAIHFPSYVYDQSNEISISRNHNFEYYDKVYNTLLSTYKEMKKELESNKFNTNWLLIILFVSLRRFDFKSSICLFLEMIKNPVSSLKSIFFIINKRIR